jgi:phage shock protein PspC (stress-responsive transcriptional regulator)
MRYRRLGLKATDSKKNKKLIHMKKTISINISGIIFHIEEDGYEKLRNYLSSIQKYFASYEDNKEIIADIESRIAEIFLGKLNPGKQVIAGEDVDKLIVTMGNISDFEAIEEEEKYARHASGNTAYATEADTATATATTATTTTAKKLYRDISRKLLGGVAAGIAHYFTIDPLWIRLLFCAAFFDFFFLPGSFSSVSFITYVILWLVIPGSTTLQEDKTIKKFYRNPDQKTIGGVASGIAAYFGVDVTIVRLIFVLGFIFFGTGLLLYLILWAITPVAKTITEKMQMQGEPVTLSNIEQNIKKNFAADENGEESTLVKILLFPFRLIATIVGGISRAVGPIALFGLDVIRVGAGILLVVIAVSIFISMFITLGVSLGIIAAYDFIKIGDVPIELLQNSFPALGFISIFFLVTIPALFVGQMGTSLIAKRNTIKAPFGWTLFGIWIIALIATSVTVPAYAGQFRTKGYYETTRTFDTDKKTVYLNVREAGDDTFDEVRLFLEPYEGTEPKLVQRFEARGRNRQDAIANAQDIEYTISQADSVITFDSNYDFKRNAKFRAQELSMTLYIPYEQLFMVDESLTHLIRGNDLEGGNKLYKFVKDQGLICQNCLDKEVITGEIRTSQDGNTREFMLRDFDRVNIGSAFIVNIRPGEEYKVRVSGKKEDIADVRAVVSGRELEVKFDRGNFLKNLDRSKIQVDITMPSIAGLHFHGASEATVKGFDDDHRVASDDVDIQLSGAAQAEVNIHTRRITVSVNGAAELELNGRADRLDAEVSSASKLRAFDFIAEEAEVDVSSAGLAEIHAKEKLMAEASSAGRVLYRGEASVDSNTSSAGSVRREESNNNDNDNNNDRNADIEE